MRKLLFCILFLLSGCMPQKTAEQTITIVASFYPVYILAKNMLPNRLLPKYKLFCLYREQRDSIKMYKIGQEALLTEIKITSTKALRIKKEIKRSLSQRCDKIWQCALEK